MDFISTNFPLFFYILLFSGLVFVLYNRFYPESLARIRIKKIIKYFLFDKHYKLFENIYLTSNNGKNVFIRQLVVSPYGLFIIETCHFRNKIFGSDHQVKWLSRGLMNSKVFINPGMSLKSSCESLAESLHIPHSACNVINVFTGNSKLESPKPENSCKPDSLIRTISQYRDIRIGPELLPDIVCALKNIQKISQSSSKKHKIHPQLQ